MSRADVKKRRYDKVRQWCLRHRLTGLCDRYDKMTLRVWKARMNAAGFKRDARGNIVKMEAP